MGAVVGLEGGGEDGRGGTRGTRGEEGRRGRKGFAFDDLNTTHFSSSVVVREREEAMVEERDEGGRKREVDLEERRRVWESTSRPRLKLSREACERKDQRDSGSACSRNAPTSSS